MLKKRCQVFLFVLFSLFVELFAEHYLSFEQAFLYRGEPLLKPLSKIIGDGGKDRVRMQTVDGFALFHFPNKKPVQLLGESFLKKFNPELSFDQLVAFSADFNQLIFKLRGRFFLLYPAQGELESLPIRSEAINLTFSPDGKKIAYNCQTSIQQGAPECWNLFYYDLNLKKEIPVALTDDQLILNGYASWVYYEEILGRASNYRAFEWSLDGNHLIYLRFDQKGMEPFYLVDYSSLYGRLETQYYPKAGQKNPHANLIVFSAKDQSSVQISLTGDVEYVNFLKSVKNGFFFQTLNREQNFLQVFYFDFGLKKATLLWQERGATWIDFLEGDHFWPINKDEIYFLSERNGWRNLYIYRRGQVNPLTDNNFNIEKIIAVDTAHQKIFILAEDKASWQNNLFRFDLQSKKMKPIFKEQGSYQVRAISGGNFLLVDYSSLQIPLRRYLADYQGKLISLLEDSAQPGLKEALRAKVELTRLKTEDGWELPAKIYYPPDFRADRRYPLLLSIYGGPGARSVSNSFGRSLQNFYLAQLGIIVLQVDHRGSGHFGKKGMDYLYQNLGKYEIIDFRNAARELLKRGQIDERRILIWGGSYGGYLAALAVVRENDFFKFGIADFSVTDWLYYDSVYTERYMNLPQNNQEGYRQGSILTYTDRYRGGLLLSHGSLDDNVHPQNSLQLFKALAALNRPVEFIFYPGERHGYRYFREFYYRRCLQFIVDHLLPEAQLNFFKD